MREEPRSRVDSMEGRTHAAVTIQTEPVPVPTVSSWFGEVAVIAQYLRHRGVLSMMEEQVRFVRRRMTPQPLQALLAPAFEPLADGSRRHPEGRGDVLLLPALLLQLPGAPPPLTPVELRRRAHAPSVATL